MNVTKIKEGALLKILRGSADQPAPVVGTVRQVIELADGTIGLVWEYGDGSKDAMAFDPEQDIPVFGEDVTQ